MSEQSHTCPKCGSPTRLEPLTRGGRPQVALCTNDECGWDDWIDRARATPEAPEEGGDQWEPTLEDAEACAEFVERHQRNGDPIILALEWWSHRLRARLSAATAKPDADRVLSDVVVALEWIVDITPDKWPDPGDAIAHAQDLASRALERAREFSAARTPADNPCADALDKLWRDIILARNPGYGDWEYPGQAYRHLLAEFKEIRAARTPTVSPEGEVEFACQILDDHDMYEEREELRRRAGLTITDHPEADDE